MAVLTEPGADKAAITAGGTDLVHFSFPIEKSEDTATINPVDGTPDIEIAGKCTDGTLDSDLQVVDPEASARWIKTWFDTGANIRAAHDPKWPAGRGLSVDPSDPHRIKVLVADPRAKHLVRQKVLKDFSIGIMHPDVRVGDPRFRHLDPMGKATGGIITDRPDGLTGLGEISLVDRGANFGASFQLVKAAADGTAEWVGELSAPGDVLTKMAVPDPAGGKRRKTVTVDLPANMSLSIKPSDLAKLTTFKQKLVQEQAVTKAAAPVTVKASVPLDGAEIHKAVKAATDVDTPELAAIKVAEAGVYKPDIDTATRRRLASEGRALPNLSYPVETHEDAMNAAGLAVSGHGDVGAAKKLIRRIARKEGWADVLDRLKGGKKTKVAVPADAKAATPDVAKCDCDGGMRDGKPCTNCKAGKKAAKRALKAAVHDSAESTAVAKAARRRAIRAAQDRADAWNAKSALTKKKKVMCGSCGARQNRKHAMCSECGRPLAGAIPVMKNHAYTCLGCGKDLDKGEKFCPGCGKENPGYLPEADHQIPANQGKAAKAGKKAKGKKKGKPFGGSQAPPFGAKDNDKDSGDDDDGGKAGKAARVIKGRKGKKGNGKVGSQTPGSAGGVPGQHETPVPPHRDAATAEEFTRPGAKEASAADPEMAAALALKALGVPRHLGALHALTCPAYSPQAVAKAFPDASFAGIDLAEWQNEAATKAATAPLDQAQSAMALWHNANALRNADPYLLADLREAAHKAFRDANPGPGTFPAPGEIGPARYSRPYISEGHAAAFPGHDAPHSARLPEVGGINAQDHTRGYLSAGHASESPQNTGGTSPMPAPSSTGVPTGAPASQYVSTTATEGASHALSAMHDHISRVFPDICPMDASLHIAQHPVPVPVGVPTPSKAPGARKAAKGDAEKRAKRVQRKAVRAGKRKAAKIRRKAVAKRRAIEAKVLKGKMSVDDGRAKLGLDPVTPEVLGKAATAVTETPAPSAEDALVAAVKTATAPLRKQLRAQDKALRQVRKTTDAIASQPDTSAAPFRGVALSKSSAAPAGPLNPSGLAEQAQLTKLRLLHDEWRNSPSPEQREAAYAEYTRQLGIASMTPPT